MKNGIVLKNAAFDGAEDEMALVNSYACRELSAEEVYLFTVALCDNDVDRDYERFSLEALREMEKLFVGKTGILDHNPTANNQKARIISCKTERVEGRATAVGDPLYRLTARAYILRTDGNRELIEQIEAGIVKEVSVGCSMGSTVCSVCGNDMRSPMCEHHKGRVYDGTLCYGELREPRDAYEFSFVAVPAQRAAGVIKSGVKEKQMDEWKKALGTEGEVTLSKGESDRLREYIAELQQEHEYAKAYREELVGRLKKALRDKGVELDYATENCIIGKLSVGETQALLKALSKKERRVRAQLYSADSEKPVGNTEFRI